MQSFVEHDEPQEPNPWTRARFGTNVLVGLTTSSSVVRACGSALFQARLRADGQLFVSADLYDSHGSRLGAFVSHVWQTAQRDAELACTPKHVHVYRRTTGDVLLSVEHRENELLVRSMDLWTRDGKHCVVDNDGRLAISTPRRGEIAQWHEHRTFETALDHIDLATIMTPASPRPPVPLRERR
jgi:hypothetical protein